MHYPVSFPAHKQNSPATTSLHHFLEHINLCDPWRVTDSGAHKYMCYLAAHQSLSQTDYFLITMPLWQNHQASQIHLNIVSDRAPISLSLALTCPSQRTVCSVIYLVKSKHLTSKDCINLYIIGPNCICSYTLLRKAHLRAKHLQDTIIHIQSHWWVKLAQNKFYRWRNKTDKLFATLAKQKHPSTPILTLHNPTKWCHHYTTYWGNTTI